jgi:hypothetical protein
MPSGSTTRRRCERAGRQAERRGALFQLSTAKSKYLKKPSRRG